MYTSHIIKLEQHSIIRFHWKVKIYILKNLYRENDSKGHRLVFVPVQRKF